MFINIYFVYNVYTCLMFTLFQHTEDIIKQQQQQIEELQRALQRSQQLAQQQMLSGHQSANKKVKDRIELFFIFLTFKVFVWPLGGFSKCEEL